MSSCGIVSLRDTHGAWLLVAYCMHTLRCILVPLSVVADSCVVLLLAAICTGGFLGLARHRVWIIIVHLASYPKRLRVGTCGGPLLYHSYGMLAVPRALMRWLVHQVYSRAKCALRLLD